MHQLPTSRRGVICIHEKLLGSSWRPSFPALLLQTCWLAALHEQQLAASACLQLVQYRLLLQIGTLVKKTSTQTLQLTICSHACGMLLSSHLQHCRVLLLPLNLIVQVVTFVLQNLVLESKKTVVTTAPRQAPAGRLI
jgi:hypothetical protein